MHSKKVQHGTETSISGKEKPTLSMQDRDREGQCFGLIPLLLVPNGRLTERAKPIDEILLVLYKSEGISPELTWFFMIKALILSWLFPREPHLFHNHGIRIQ